MSPGGGGVSLGIRRAKPDGRIATGRAAVAFASRRYKRACERWRARRAFFRYRAPQGEEAEGRRERSDRKWSEKF